jgi:hypothetical protein
MRERGAQRLAMAGCGGGRQLSAEARVHKGGVQLEQCRLDRPGKGGCWVIATGPAR